MDAAQRDTIPLYTAVYVCPLLLHSQRTQGGGGGAGSAIPRHPQCPKGTLWGAGGWKHTSERIRDFEMTCHFKCTSVMGIGLVMFFDVVWRRRDVGTASADVYRLLAARARTATHGYSVRLNASFRSATVVGSGGAFTGSPGVRCATHTSLEPRGDKFMLRTGTGAKSSWRSFSRPSTGDGGASPSGSVSWVCADSYENFRCEPPSEQPSSPPDGKSGPVLAWRSGASGPVLVWRWNAPPVCLPLGDWAPGGRPRPLSPK